MKGYGDLVTIGALAQMAGVSVRTLQYYDEKNLLKPIISDGGRRHYDRDAILRLEQILFLKSLGFSLEEIGKKILPLKDARALNEVLIIQREMILDEIKRLNKIVTLLDPAIAETRESQEINMERMITIIETMKRGNSFGIIVKYLDREQIKRFVIQIMTMTDKVDSKAVFDKLEALHREGVDPEGEEGQAFAKQWWDMVNTYASGDSDLLEAMKNAGRDVENWPEELNHLKAEIEGFLSKSLSAYIKNQTV